MKEGLVLYMMTGFNSAGRNFGDMLNLKSRPPRQVLPSSFSQRLFAGSAGRNPSGQVIKSEYNRDAFQSSKDALRSIRTEIGQVKERVSWLPSAEIDNTHIDAWISDLDNTISKLEGLSDYGSSEQLQSTKAVLNQVQSDLATAKDDTVAASPISDAALLSDMQDSQATLSAAMTAIDPLRAGSDLYEEAYRELDAALTLIGATTLADDVQAAGQTSYQRISNAQGLLASVASADPTYSTASTQAEALLTEKNTLEPSVVAARQSQAAKFEKLARIEGALDQALELTDNKSSKHFVRVDFTEEGQDDGLPIKPFSSSVGRDYNLQRTQAMSRLGARVDFTSSSSAQDDIKINPKDKSSPFLRRL